MFFRFNRTNILFALIMLAPVASHASGFNSSLDKGFTYKSSEGNFKFKAGARLHLDVAAFNEDTTALDDDAIVRRARLSLGLEVFKNWRLSAQYDLSDEEERYRSLWLRYKGFERTYITIGQFQEPFSMEELTSSNNFVFMERSLANALNPGINVGVALQRWGKNWGATGGAFWETYIEDAHLFAAKEGYGASGRFTFAPIKNHNTVLHLGTSLSYRAPDDGERIRIRTQPESDVTEEYLISTGRMRNVDNQVIYGVEGAVTLGAVLLQGEYLFTKVLRYGEKKDETFDGGYFAASWLINGKQRRYSSRSGVFGAVKPDKEGVWELAIRRSYLDLNSSTGTITGGRQANTTLALNWYHSRNLRLMFNFIEIDTDEETNNDDPSILQLRVQLVY